MEKISRRVAMLSLAGGAISLASKEETAAAFLKMIDRPRVPLAAEVEGTHFTYASDASERVPGILMKPTGPARKLPVVIALHGTGGNKESQVPLLNELARKGFLAVAIDGRYHGERTTVRTGSTEYNFAILRTYRTGKEHPFLYDSVWDIMRLIDYLETRDDVDATRIGAIGFSKGGMELYLAAAVDPRIRVAVPCIGVQSFRWALDHDAWHSRAGTLKAALDGAAKDEGVSVNAAFVKRFYDRVAPGVYGRFDGPAMLPLIAPRPLLCINGGADARTPLPGLMECVDAAKKAYAAAGASEKFQHFIEPDTGHKVTPEAQQMANDWLVRWLKAVPAASQTG